MRRLLYITSVLIIMACKNEAPYKDVDFKVSEIENSEVGTLDDEIEILKESSYKPNSISFSSYKTFINQKLQKFYDLSLLKINHPEFSNDISKQLSKLSNDSIQLKATTPVSIQNIHQIGKVKIINDSTQNLILRFEKVYKDSTETDSLNAIITTKAIIIDGIQTQTSSVVFSKIK